VKYVNYETPYLAVIPSPRHFVPLKNVSITKQLECRNGPRGLTTWGCLI